MHRSSNLLFLSLMLFSVAGCGFSYIKQEKVCLK